MRKFLAAVLITAAACRSGAPGSTGRSGAADAGAADAAGAIDRFLAAARSDDVQGMARVFGTRAGPIGSRESQEAVLKRMRALQCYLRHDRSRTLGATPASGGAQVLRVELRQRELVRETRFTAVPGPGQQWFVESFEINALSDFCRP